MKGNNKVITALNGLLADELTAINQYFVHTEMAENWGYGKLNAAVRARAIGEMKHAEKLIERILFLEGSPIVSKLNDIHIGANVETQLKNDHAAEVVAIKGYNEAIRLAEEAGDNGSRDLCESILNDEEDHIDWIEAQQSQIQQMGVQTYLAEQMG